MGEVELNVDNGSIFVYADLIFYGQASDSLLAERIANDISRQWNEPAAEIQWQGRWLSLQFIITGTHSSNLQEIDVLSNTNPRNNYFRIEHFAKGNISFVDGLNSNTGYFKLENLLAPSTTAAHEFGHTLGLPHPIQLDIRGKGLPGIMYPRGTLVDPEFQYDPAIRAGERGGTLNPVHRKVLLSDIEDLQLHRLPFNNKMLAIVGDFSSMYHEAHQPE